MCRGVIVLILLWACTEKNVVEPEELSGTLDVLSYNIHGLPSAVTGDDTPHRIEQIAPLLDAFSLVGIQEDWIEEFFPLLQEGSDFPYSDRFDEPLDDDKVYGAGLSYFGRFPSIKSEHIYYESCFGFLDNSSDCFASKGMQRLELEIADSSVMHIYNTHLEAGGGEEDQQVRAEQIDLILSEINGYSAGVPIILMGDFNLEPLDETEGELLAYFREEGGLRQTCMEQDCAEPNHIDQIFIRSGTEISLDVLAWERKEEFVDAAGVDLSDHPAIFSQISWEH